MNKILSVHQPQYIPWLGYLDKIKNSDIFVYLDNCQYKHREFQNRNRILTKNGELWLAVPALVKGKRDQSIKEVKINNDSDWQKEHWRSISLAYSKAPGFTRHVEFFDGIYTNKKWTFLLDLNVAIIEYLLKQFEIKTPIKFESALNTSQTSTERIIEICKKTESDIYLSGSGAKAYMDEKRLSDEGIELRYQQFEHPVYKQFNNKSEFMPYMSSLDYLFNKV